MWRVEYYEHDFTLKGSFEIVDPQVTLKHKDISAFTCEIPLSDPNLTADLLGPKATNFVLWRNDTQILEGEVTENDLAGERDTLLLEHQDWLFYLSERIFPFHYPFLIGDYNENPANWPKKWTTTDLTTIVTKILQAMMDDDADTPEFFLNNSLTGVTTNYQIDPGDETSVLDHIRKLAEQDTGFDYYCRQPVGQAIRFHMEAPNKDNGEVIYTITRDVGEIGDGLEWKNTGPDSTWLLGLGSGSMNKSRAAEDTYAPSRAQYYRRDKVVDFGEIRNYQMLQRLTASEGKKQRFPQKTINLPITVDTAQLPNFWASDLGRPYSLLGRRIHVGPMLFRNYHTIDADFKILDMTIEPDSDGNDYVTFGLDMING